MAMRYVRIANMIKIRTACRAPLASAHSPCGLGALGLTVAKGMVNQGARRLIPFSRRALPQRTTRSSTHHYETTTSTAIQTILTLEHLGATVHCLSIDITLPTAASTLLTALSTLNLPPVAGVIHATGTIHNQLISQSTPSFFAAVLAPKVRGALTLHTCFPPASANLDFFVLSSSCGQLLGFLGQASYASGNAFLDALALTRSRRAQGDRNALSLLWTSWRGLGMGVSSSGALEAELYARGITDISPDEAFRAWSPVAALPGGRGSRCGSEDEGA
ncbi:KR domain-containing protein [Aspergillus multicolor]|uniref:beta-ketoacyl reductase n=1 Tax=Aspergillus multicolor TaxID=41759 RepID=UPI003CCCCF26